MINFGPWLPDQPNFRPEKAFDVLNVIPHEGGYHPWHSWNKVVNAPGGGQVPLACNFFIAPSGTVYNIMGSTAALYLLDGATGSSWLTATRTVGGAYATPTDGAWFHTQYDNNVFWANGVDVVQLFNLLGGTNFINVAYPAGPPISKFLATVRRFVVAANLSINSKEVAWSGLAEPLLWTPDPVTLADSQVLPTGGEITGLCGGEYGVILQQHALQRMVFSGPPTTFEFEKISTILGCEAPRSVAQYGDVIFFLSTSGVKMLRGAQEISDIGDGKVDTWLMDNIDDADLWRVTSTIDVKNKLYLLAVPVDDAASLCDLILAYHWPTGEWSKIGYLNYLVCQTISQQAYHVDNIDTIIGNNIDTGMTTLSFDSPSLISSGVLQISAFSPNRELGNFDGEHMASMVMTGDVPVVPGRKALVRGARPMFEGAVNGLTLTPYVRDRLQDNPLPKASAPVNRNGICPIRANGRYHRFKVDTSVGGDWKYALGIDDLTVSEMAK
jgi:hypothetical protein